MLLIDPELIRSRLILDNKAEVNAVLKSSIVGATPRLEVALHTSFTKGSTEDVFYLGPSAELYNGSYMLRLRNGFVRKAPDVLVRVSDTFGGPYEKVTQYLTMYERGVLVLPDAYGSVFKGKYVLVEYDYGFENQKEVPAWLQEVALATSVKVLSMSAINDKKDELSEVFEFVDSHSAAILNAHTRTGSFLIHPV